MPSNTPSTNSSTLIEKLKDLPPEHRTEPLRVARQIEQLKKQFSAQGSDMDSEHYIAEYMALTKRYYDALRSATTAFIKQKQSDQA